MADLLIEEARKERISQMEATMHTMIASKMKILFLFLFVNTSLGRAESMIQFYDQVSIGVPKTNGCF